MEWIRRQCDMQDQRRIGRAEGRKEGKEEGKEEGKLEAFVNIIKSGLTTLDALKASGQVTPAELEQIESALQDK